MLPLAGIGADGVADRPDRSGRAAGRCPARPNCKPCNRLRRKRPTRSKLHVRATFRLVHRRGWQRVASGCKPCCRASRRAALALESTAKSRAHDRDRRRRVCSDFRHTRGQSYRSIEMVAAKIRRFDATSSTVQRSITVAEVAERARQNRVSTAPRAQSVRAGLEAKNNDVLQGEMS
jgi:hypothetical protein